jgi:hypothetical protein
MKKHRKARKGRPVHKHHFSYDPEIIIKVYAGEHQILTLINRYSKRTVSRGFIRNLKAWIALNEYRAEEIE